MPSGLLLTPSPSLLSNVEHFASCGVHHLHHPLALLNSKCGTSSIVSIEHIGSPVVTQLLRQTRAFNRVRYSCELAQVKDKIIGYKLASIDFYSKWFWEDIVSLVDDNNIWEKSRVKIYFIWLFSIVVSPYTRELKMLNLSYQKIICVVVLFRKTNSF